MGIRIIEIFKGDKIIKDRVLTAEESEKWDKHKDLNTMRELINNTISTEDLSGKGKLKASVKEVVLD